MKDESTPSTSAAQPLPKSSSPPPPPPPTKPKVSFLYMLVSFWLLVIFSHVFVI